MIIVDSIKEEIRMKEEKEVSKEIRINNKVEEIIVLIETDQKEQEFLKENK